MVHVQHGTETGDAPKYYTLTPAGRKRLKAETEGWNRLASGIAAAICQEVAQLRRHQRAFLKSSRKFPNFIEVGIDARERVHDWQLETRQAVGIARQPDGRYTLAFGPTTLLLKPDAADDFIGYPYDNLGLSGFPNDI